jgi:hypothetical protein
MQKVNPTEILRKIEKGEVVEYDQIFVDGYLDLTNLNLQQRTISITPEERKTLGVSENQTARGHPTLKGWGMLRAARFG